MLPKAKMAGGIAMEQTRKCPSCGGVMIFNPGFKDLVCQSCGHKEAIPELVSKIPVEEMDFLTAQNKASHDWGMEAKVVHCKQCGGATIQNKLQMSGFCPFCGSTTVEAADPEKDIMAPNGVIPFEITENRALYIFNDWIKDRFLAPELLARDAKLNKFYGVYVPLFTFDVLTINRYTGSFSQNNRTLFKSGRFQHQVDDFPVVASKVLGTHIAVLPVRRGHRIPASRGRSLQPDPCAAVIAAEAWAGRRRSLAQVQFPVGDDGVFRRQRHAGQQQRQEQRRECRSLFHIIIPLSWSLCL